MSATICPDGQDVSGRRRISFGSGPRRARGRSAVVLLGLGWLLAGTLGCREVRSDPPDVDRPIGSGGRTGTGPVEGGEGGGPGQSTDAPPAGSACTGGDLRCAAAGEAVEVCLKTGEWSVVKTCPGTCQAGACVDGTPPGEKCGAGMHECEGICVSDTSPKTCNRSCTACAAPMGGEATCDGTKCSASCPSGQQACNDRCVPIGAPCDGCPVGKNECNGLCVEATDLSACGTSCTPCPTSPNGKPVCDGDKCDLICDPGFHACGTTCVSNNDPKTCGTSCTPCDPVAGGKAGCDGTACKPECPSNTFLCMGACIAVGRACDGVCPSGKHDCGGNCVVNTSTNSCGTTACKACQPPANADATCDGNNCGFKCRGGFHLCGNECKDDKSTNSCGNSCSACTPPAGAKPACRNGKCDFDCTSGRRCHDQCIADSKPCDGACKAGFTECRGTCVASGTVGPEVCDGKDNDCNGAVDDGLAARPCSPACAGSQKCNGAAGWSTATCARTDNDPNRCGSSCSPCAPRAGFTVGCSGGQCTYSCAQSSAEICDGKDNDCNGLIDDNLVPRACSPACAGTQKCNGASGWSTATCARTDNDPNRCGSSCSPCAQRAGYRAGCSGGTCTYTCLQGCCGDSDCSQGCDAGTCRFDLSGGGWNDGMYGNTLSISQNKTSLTYRYVSGPQAGLVIQGQFVTSNRITFQGQFGTDTGVIINKNKISWPAGEWNR
jgi:hypothetical protein